MKTLREFIDFSDFDEFDLSILPHISISYKEHNIFNKGHLILEKYGVYDGLNDLILRIEKDIKKMIKNPDNKEGFQLKYSNENLKDIKNIFFSKLIIDISLNDENEEGNYEDNDEINKDNLLFDEVYIDIYTRKDINNIHIDDIVESIKHEFIHAYNNYNLLLKNNKSLTELSDSDFYNKLYPKLYFNEFEKYIRKVLYFTLQEEQNAFIGQLSDELRQNKSKVKNPKDALNILKNSIIYQTYKDLYVHIQEYKDNKLSKEYIDLITDEYNNICNTKLTANKVFKKLEFLIKKSIKKFDNIIGKLCLENLNNIKTLIPSNVYLNEN